MKEATPSGKVREEREQGRDEGQALNSLGAQHAAEANSQGVLDTWARSEQWEAAERRNIWEIIPTEFGGCG